MSDHSIIQITIKANGSLVPCVGAPREDGRNADLGTMSMGVRWRRTSILWPLYEIMIKELADTADILDTSTIDQKLQKLTNWFTEVGDLLFKRVRKLGNPKSKWWSDELSHLRFEVRVKRRRWERSGEDGKVLKLVEWKRAMAEYRRAIVVRAIGPEWR